MPTYEYKCPDCGHKFERFQSIMAGPVRTCPKCGKRKVKRLLGTGAGLIFKGSGFYQTDYRSEGYKTSQKADTAGASGDSKSTESKPADGKPSEGKPAESKPAEAKPAPTSNKEAASAVKNTTPSKKESKSKSKE